MVSNTYFNGYCQYRLPCGYCEKLGRDCPKGYTTTTTYTSTTETVTLNNLNDSITQTIDTATTNNN